MMDFSNYNIGLGITGSFCTFAKARKEIQRLCDMGANVVPVFSFNAQTCDTRFGSAKDYVDGICEITGNEGIRTICAAEPIGPNNFLDIMVIAPCTGNTAAKLCNGITDTPVLMATKAHMRNGKPLVIAISTNDALGASFKNIGMLMNMKNIYFVPFGQDNCKSKPNSMIAKMELLPDTIEAALAGKQIQPILQTRRNADLTEPGETATKNAGDVLLCKKSEHLMFRLLLAGADFAIRNAASVTAGTLSARFLLLQLSPQKSIRLSRDRRVLRLQVFPYACLDAS